MHHFSEQIFRIYHVKRACPSYSITISYLHVLHGAVCGLIYVV
jgi:hypothetical protein